MSFATEMETERAFHELREGLDITLTSSKAGDSEKHLHFCNQNCEHLQFYVLTDHETGSRYFTVYYDPNLVQKRKLETLIMQMVNKVFPNCFGFQCEPYGRGA